MCRLVVSVVMIVGVTGLLAACGGTTKPTQTLTTSYTSGKTTTAVSTRTPPTKQEIVKAQGCLMRERVRPAKHTPYRPQVPRGANEVTRNGLPMTPQEYEATVRRCLTKASSASAKAARKK
jgi:hypothetical protein